jgi:hypothetical protein
MSNATEYPGAIDVTGYNYTEDRYDIDHQTYPDRIIYGSECQHSMSSWKATRDKSYVFGQFIWTGIDYLGEANAWPSRGFYSGLLDFGGFQKPRGYFRKALWDDEPVIYIGTYPVSNKMDFLSMDAWSIWNYYDGDMIRVVCYTNCTQAQLMLNNKVVGEMKDYDDNTGIISWDILYQPGKLEAVGYDGKKITCQYDIQTSGRPYAITASVENTTLYKDRDLAQIVVQIVDENAIPVMFSDDEITCKIEGPARLLGLESSNNSDMGNYRDNVQRTFHGRTLAYIQTTGDAGEMSVIFTAPWLKGTEVKFQIK